jgi:uncharacterized protein YjbJ (UPF0337 family)
MDRWPGLDEIKAGGIMDSDTLKRRWPRLKEDAKAQWSRLSLEELDQVEGDAAKLTSLLQQRYGYEPQRAQREVQSFIEVHSLQR